MNMILKVDKEELQNVSDELFKSSSSFEEEIKLWEKEISELKEIWEGYDAEVFYNRISAYLEKLKMVSACSSSISSVISKTNDEYIKKDDEFANDLKKENDELDELDEQNNN